MSTEELAEPVLLHSEHTKFMTEKHHKNHYIMSSTSIP